MDTFVRLLRDLNVLSITRDTRLIQVQYAGVHHTVCTKKRLATARHLIDYSASGVVGPLAASSLAAGSAAGASAAAAVGSAGASVSASAESLA